MAEGWQIADKCKSQPRVTEINPGHKLAGPNAAGKSSPSPNRRSTESSSVQQMTIALAPNSASTWRQAPQGIVANAVGVYTASASSLRAPCATAWQIALRSAQFDNPNDAFSTLALLWISPLSVSTAAPTAKRE